MTMNNRIKPLLFIGCGVLIVISAFLWHVPVQVVDSLTKEPVSDISVHISWIRIVFEPFFGPWFYLLRADQPLLQAVVVFWWGVIFLLFFYFYKAVKSYKSLKTAIYISFLKWIKVFPLVLVVWMFIVFALVFLPLPTNSIKNFNPEWVLVNAHSHSHYSHDGVISQKRLMKWHEKNGFDAFFLTEHNNHLKTLELIGAQKSGEIPETPLVLCGQEYSGSIHILLLGLTQDFLTKDMPDSTAINTAHSQNGISIIPHWFDKCKNTVDYYIQQGTDGYEIANQGEGIQYDPKVIKEIVEKCREHGLILLGNCDYHGYGNAAFVWNALYIPNWKQLDQDGKRNEIMEIFRNRENDRIRTFNYSDRTVFSLKYLPISPVYNLSYFRTLDIFQVLSWLVWLGFGYILFIKTNFFQTRILPFISLASSVFIVVLGIVFLRQGVKLGDYNHIYTDYGNYFLWGGLFFLIYSLLALKFFKKN